MKPYEIECLLIILSSHSADPGAHCYSWKSSVERLSTEA